MLQVQHSNVDSPRLLGDTWVNLRWKERDSIRGGNAAGDWRRGEACGRGATGKQTSHEKTCGFARIRLGKRVSGGVNNPKLQVQHWNVNWLNSGHHPDRPRFWAIVIVAAQA
jgi:hypothetical protein